MKLSVSNLSWDYKDSEFFLEKIKNIGFNCIELALTKIHEWDEFDREKTLKIRDSLKKFDLEVCSIQSIFFNSNIYSLDETESILNHLEKIIVISKTLDFDRVVFGSPKLRKVKNFKSIENLFKKIDELFDKHNMIFLIEPNSKYYGGDFFFSLSEVVNFIKKNEYKRIRTMVDTHNSFLENLNPIEEIIKYFEYVEHIHISEKGLSPIKDVTFHRKFSDLLIESEYKKIITYELMKSENFVGEIETFYKIYGR